MGAAPRKELVELSHELHRRGWVANHDGNLSARLDSGDRFLITPTAMSKRRVDVSMLVVVDDRGVKVSGRMRPFSELGLHLTIYESRPDVAAVVHAHPPYATGFAMAGRGLDVPTAAEPIVSLGPSVPIVPYARPGAAAEAALRPFATSFNAVLLGSHGVISWGPDLETAFLRMELVEHAARCNLVAHQLGGPIALPEDDVAFLTEKRRKAGLEPPGFSESGRLEVIVGEEVSRALGKAGDR